MKKKILCTICARGGSKGLKNKNIKKLEGKKLIHHTIDIARKIKFFNHIVVSSDSPQILKTSRKKVDFCIKRPKKYSSEYSSKLDAIKHALLSSEKKYSLKFDIIVDLDVTSPLRSINDINKAMSIFLKNNASNLVSGNISRKNPYFNQVMYQNGKLKLVCKFKKKIVRRQDAPKVYDLNASIYIWNRRNILNSSKLISNKTIFFEMPYYRSIDIDDNLDFEIVKQLKKIKKYDT